MSKLLYVLLGMSVLLSCEKESEPLDYSNQEFLELSQYGEVNEMSEKDLKTVMRAIGRLDVDYKHYQYKIQQTSVKGVNISEDLFQLIERWFDHTNELSRRHKNSHSNSNEFMIK